MKHISLPKKFIVEESEKGKKAQVVIEPCHSGYGMTLGNALRRVLLSSLPGGAVTAVKISGVQHEFSTIENAPEDVVEIILSLKQLKVKVHSDEPVILHLKARGEKEVTAADIEPSSDAEIINKDLSIVTLNEKDTELEMELTVAKGIGYVPVEEQNKNKEKEEIGVILIDSIFTPVVNVGLKIEATRVGQKVDYDKIVLDVETDGTISPEEAVQKAAEILSNQFSWIMEGGREEVEEVDLEAPVEIPEKDADAKTQNGQKYESEEGEGQKAAEVDNEKEVSAPSEDKDVEVEEVTKQEIEDEPKKKRGRPRKVEIGE